MNFHGTKKSLLMVSHDPWAQTRKIVIHGIWNPRAWTCKKNHESQSRPIKSQFKNKSPWVIM